jgi:uncharacterized protein (TIGR02466 family)
VATTGQVNGHKMLKDIFPVKIYETEFPEYEKIQASLTKEITDIFNNNLELYANHRLFNNAYSLEGTEQGQHRDLHKILKHQEVIEFIRHHIGEYWRGLGYTRFHQADIVHMWSNLTPKGGNIIQHNHSPFEIAGSFYVDASPEQGCLALVDPNELIRGRLPYYENEESKQGRYYFDHIVEPKPGKLVLFPGWLYHKTQKNTVDRPRIVIGLNAGLMYFDVRM